MPLQVPALSLYQCPMRYNSTGLMSDDLFNGTDSFTFSG